MPPQHVLLLVSTLLLTLHLTTLEAIKKDMGEVRSESDPKTTEELYTVYQQVSDLLEILDTFDRDVICEKFDVSTLDPLTQGKEWNVKFGKVFQLLKHIACAEGQDAISGQ